MEGMTVEILVTDEVCQISPLNYERMFHWVTLMQFVSLQTHESLQGRDQDIIHFLNESMRYEPR
jgi:hypothetical protein